MANKTIEAWKKAKNPRFKLRGILVHLVECEGL